MTASALDRTPLHLELGCGSTKHNPQAVGVDLLTAPGVDVVGDAMQILRDLPDGSVDSISSYHFLEHIDDAEGLVREAARVLRPGGTFVAEIPHFANPWFYSDPTHQSFFGLYTFCYWVADHHFQRQVPRYSEPVPLELVEVVYHFKSSRPWVIRHGVKKALTLWVNLSRRTQEFYEEFLTSVLPPHELRYVLRRI